MTNRYANRLKALLFYGARQLVVSLAALLFALAIGMIIISFMDVNPFEAMAILFKGALGNKNAVMETIVKMTPLIFTGLSYAMANRCGLTNIGMEGQLYMGALFSAIASIYISGLPAPLHIALAVLAGFIGGGLWGFIPGLLKVRFGSSEIISTVMLNFIATNFIVFMVSGPIAEPLAYNMNQSMPILDSAKFPAISGSRLHIGILIALFCVLLFYVFLWKSKKGYEVRVSGQNLQAARYSGININRNVLLIMFLAGGLAGLAGANEIQGIQHRLLPGFSPGYGFDGIAVALIGKNSPVGIIFGAFLFGILRSGGNSLQISTGIPVAIIYIIQALVIIAVCASQLFTSKKIYFNKPKDTNDAGKGGEQVA